MKRFNCSHLRTIARVLSCLFVSASLASADMTAPGDPVAAVRAIAGQNSSTLSPSGDVPSAEGPANAIDNDSSTKYLNRGQTGVGLIVTTQAAGPRVITGLRFATGGDNPSRDPITVTLEGTNDIGATTSLNSSWTLLYDGPSGLAVDPGRNRVGTAVTFSNTTAYRSFRLLVTGLRAASDSMQFSEIELTSTDSSTPGTVFTVTSLADPGDGVLDTSGINGGTTLREAIIAAGFTAADDEIVFANELSGSITLASPLPPITTDMRITGSRAGITINGSGQHRGLLVTANSVSLNRLTMTGFKGIRGNDGVALSRRTATQATDGSGAAVDFSGGTMSITNCTFHGNTGGGGGSSSAGHPNNGGHGGGTVQARSGTLQLTNCTFTGNTGGTAGAGGSSGRQKGSGGNGGGTVQSLGGAVVLNFCTIANNTGGDGGAAPTGSVLGVPLPGSDGTGFNGAGVVQHSGTVAIGNSLLADDAKGDARGTLISNGYNLIKNPNGATLTGNTTGNLTGVDSNLDPLANNGGPVSTRALQSGSPAIDAADPASSLFSDARLFSRKVNARSDIGAFESGGVAVNNFPPQIEVNGGLTVRPGDTRVIASDRLRASDPENAQVTYRLTSPPTNGTLRLNGASLSLNSEWFQAFIDGGLLTYTANSGSTGDSFGFAVLDPNGNLTNSTFTITTGPNQAPTIVTNTGLSVDPSGTVFIRNDRLEAVDPDGDALTYTLNTVPTSGLLRRDGINLSLGDTFTQAQVSSGRVSYVAGGSATSFNFTVSDGFGGSASGSFQITIAANQPPVIATNTGTTVNGGTTRVIRNTALAATDPNNDPVTFTLTSLPTKGTLVRNFLPLGIGATFTQADIHNELVGFTAGTAQGADSFDFSISDGRGGIDDGTFAITISETAQSGPEYVVNVADDTDDGAATVAHCSFREAIHAANNDGVPSTIRFNIPGTGVHTITAQGSRFPDITAPVVIDGYTQPGARPNSKGIREASDAVLKIEIDGNNELIGLRVMAPNTTIRGLSIGNSFIGMLFIGSNVASNTIAGNHVGLRADGITPFPNSTGISGSFYFSTIGGPLPADRNVIAGNTTYGISFGSGAPDQYGRVEGNFIGTKADGTTALANGIGVYLNGYASNTIGGSSGAENLISGNTNSGITIEGVNARDNVVKGNIIGMTRNASSPLPNGTGIVISSSLNNLIGGTTPGEGNLISGNAGAGIALVDSMSFLPGGNRLFGNSITSNGGLGIDLGNDGVTANDSGDGDTGPNSLQNFPVLTSVTTGSNTVITGTLNSTPEKTFTLHFYQSETADPSGHGEGSSYLGSTSVVTGTDGNASFTTTFPGVGLTGAYVSATATDSFGSTSEFSLARAAVQTGPDYLVTVLDDTDDGTLTLAHTSLREAIQAANVDGVDSTITIIADGTIRPTSALPTLANDGSLGIFGVRETVTISGDADNSGTNNPGDLLIFDIANGANITLTGLTLSGGRNEPGAGGAISNAAGTVTVDTCTLRGNFATNGGAILNSGTMTISGTLFENNSTAASGQGGAIWSNNTLSVTGSIFYQNTAAVLGGAIASFGGFSVTDSTFSTNHSDFNGGALRLDGPAAITNSTFSNNTAVNGGGAIMSHGQTTLTNSTIAYNIALDGGGAQFFDGSATLRHVTLAYNSATRWGGGVNVAFADVTLTNTIVSQNTAAEQNDVWGGPLNAASSNNLISTPGTQLLFGSVAGNGGPTVTIALLPGSVAIDAALPIPGLTTDQRGLARSVGSMPDIGAFEMVPTVPAISPSISPASGTYQLRADVILSTTSAGALIRYTTDGSQPSETHGTLYTSPFTLYSNTNVRAVAFGGGWLPSQESSATYTIQNGLEIWRALQGLAADGSQDLAQPYNDGIPNLLKYAFNMALTASNTLTPGGNAGLPFITTDSTPRLTITFVRRKDSNNPGIAYHVEVTGNLQNWTDLDLSAATIESIDSQWERVTIVDPVSGGKRFARVRVAKTLAP